MVSGSGRGWQIAGPGCAWDGRVGGQPTPTDHYLTWAHLTCRCQQEGDDEDKPHGGGGTRALLKSGEGR